MALNGVHKIFPDFCFYCQYTHLIIRSPTNMLDLRTKSVNNLSTHACMATNLNFKGIILNQAQVKYNCVCIIDLALGWWWWWWREKDFALLGNPSICYSYIVLYKRKMTRANLYISIRETGASLSSWFGRMSLFDVVLDWLWIFQSPDHCILNEAQFWKDKHLCRK